VLEGSECGWVDWFEIDVSGDADEGGRETTQPIDSAAVTIVECISSVPLILGGCVFDVWRVEMCEEWWVWIWRWVKGGGGATGVWLWENTETGNESMMRQTNSQDQVYCNSCWKCSNKNKALYLARGNLRA
jgi:hypothetical protein